MKTASHFSSPLKAFTHPCANFLALFFRTTRLRPNCCCRPAPARCQINPSVPPAQGVALVLLFSSPPLGRVQHSSSGLALAQGQEPAEQRPGRLRTPKAHKRQHHGGDRQGRQKGLHAPNGPSENERRPGARVEGGGLEDALPSPGSWREALEEGNDWSALIRQRRRAADDMDADSPDFEMDSQGVSSPDDAPAVADNDRANEVWSQLSEATEQLPCSNPPCVQVSGVALLLNSTYTGSFVCFLCCPSSLRRKID